MCIYCDYYVWENNEGEYRDNGVIYNKKIFYYIKDVKIVGCLMNYQKILKINLKK